MKRFNVLLLIAVVLLIFSGCGAKQSNSTGDEKPTTITAVTAWATNDTLSKPFFLLQQEVEKASNGKLILKYSGGPESIPTFEQGEALRNGVVDLALTTDAYYISVVPEAMALDFSTITPDEERKNGAIDYLNQILDKKMNAIFLGRTPGREYALYTLKKVEKTADLKNLKIRGNGVYTPAIQAMGMKMLTIDPSEVYTSLERGMVDGIAWPNVGITDSSWDQRLKYKIQPNFYQSGSGFLMNKNAWSKLPDKWKKVLSDAVLKVEKENPAIMKQLINEENQKILKSGMQIITMQDGDEFLRTVNDASWKWLSTKIEKGEELQKRFSGK